MRKALLVVVVLALTSSALFWGQGGFGGGHGNFDKPVFILGLPWTLVPWPEFLIKHDFVWLIGLPFALNVLSVFVITTAIRGYRRAARSRLQLDHTKKQPYP